MPFSARAQARYAIIAIGVVIWITLNLGLYYWVHKPISPSLARALGGASVDIASALAMVIASAGLGRRILGWLALDEWSLSERLAAPAAVGFGGLSLVVMVVGAASLTRLNMMVLLAVLAALTIREIIHWCRDLSAWLWQGLPVRGFERFVSVFVIIMLAMGLVMATLPPTKFDVLTYHMAGPEQYVAHGRFYAIPYNHFLGFPQGVETLYAAQLAITGQFTGGGVLHWCVGVLTLMMVGGFVARKSLTIAGWVAAGVLLVALSVWMEMTFAYTDLLPMALMAVSLAVANQWMQDLADGLDQTGWRYAVLLGVLAGIGMSTKYSVLWMAVALGVLVLWVSRSMGLRRMLGYGVLYGTAAALTLLPWLVRNVLWYDNPFYPLIFESAEMDSIRQAWYSQPRSGLIYGSNAWQIPVLPLVATFFGLEGGSMYSATVGPLFLILTPLLGLGWSYLQPPERTIAQPAMVVIGVVWVAWTLSSAFGSYISLQTRLIFYMFVPLAVMAGLALAVLRRLPKKPLDVGFVVQAMVGFTLMLTVIEGGRLFLKSGIETYYSGEKNYRSAFLRDELGWHYETLQLISTTLPHQTSVRFLWEPRYLYCDEDRIICRPDSLMDAWYYARRTIHDPAQIAATWQSEGSEYLLVYELGRRLEAGETDEIGNTLYSADDWVTWSEFVVSYLEETWRGEDADRNPVYILYRWRE